MGLSFLYVIASYIIPSYNIASYNVIRQAAHAKGTVHHRTWTVPENVSRSGAKNWAVVSAKHPIRKACPVLSLNSGMHFPLKLLPENASHSERRIRDVVSACGLVRKACPTLSAHSGAQFPPETPPGKRIPVWSRNLGCGFRLRAVRKARPIPSGNSGSQFPQIQGDSPPPLSHAFKYAIQKHKTADRMLFFKKYTSRNLPRLHIQLPFTVANYRPPIQTRNMSPKAGHLPAWLDFGQLLVS